MVLRRIPYSWNIRGLYVTNARTRIGYDLVLGQQAGLQAHCDQYQPRYVRPEQMFRPNPIAYAVDRGVGLAVKGGDVFHMGAFSSTGLVNI